MDEFEIELKKGFLDEAAQMLTDSEQCFLELEANPSDRPTLEKIFRIAHNIKGSSKAVGFDQLGSFTHEFESLFLKVKNAEITITPGVISLLLRCNDQIKTIIDGLKDDLAATFELEDLLVEVRNATAGKLSESPAEAEVLSPEAVEEVMAEIEAAPVEEVEAEEPVEEVFVSGELSAEDRALLETFNSGLSAPAPVAAAPEAPIAPVVPIMAAAAEKSKTEAAKAKPAAAAAAPATSGASEESIRVSLARLEKLINFVGEMSILQSVLQEQALSSESQLLIKTSAQMGKVCKEVQDISMSLRMVPVKQTFQKMQRIVRDTSSILGKKVQLILEGEETELDKTVLEAIGDPLVHLVRNSVDHGIESAENREKSGKSEMGTVWLRAFHQSGKLVLEVKDDGGGINGQKLLAKAIEKGVLKPGTTLSDKDAVNLIFHPGFSTKSEVSEVSGRGVGMDVVKTNIEQLQGEVTVETEIGKGTTLRIQLPLTLAIIDGMIVENRVGTKTERFVVPLSHVHESVKPKPGELHLKTGIGEVLQLRGEVMPTFRLSNLLGKGGKGENKEQIALIFRNQETPFAVMVDDILRQQQVVVKQLSIELKSTKGFSGSAILGDGKPALILEMPELVATGKTQGRTA